MDSLWGLLCFVCKWFWLLLPPDILISHSSICSRQRMHVSLQAITIRFGVDAGTFMQLDRGRSAWWRRGVRFRTARICKERIQEKQKHWQNGWDSLDETNDMSLWGNLCLRQQQHCVYVCLKRYECKWVIAWQTGEPPTEQNRFRIDCA